MRRALTLAALSCMFAAAAAPAAADNLWIGDDAPALKVTQWFNGEAVDLAAAKDNKVLVVEFWATWCGPCVAAMPHLTELQQKYADKGVDIIGVTKPDDNNSLEQVTTFVDKNTASRKMGYRVAFDADAETFNAYMRAAGQNGIPTAFIVDKAGKVAWIGHPMNMDEPLAQVVAGNYDVQKYRVSKSLEKRASDLRGKGDYDGAARVYEALAVLDPEDHTPWSSLAYLYANNLKWPGKTREAAVRAVQVGHDRSSFLAGFATFLAGRDQEYDCRKLALKAARRAVELDPQSREANLALVTALSADGQAEEAQACAAKTVDMLKDAADLGAAAGVLGRKPLEFKELALKAAQRAAELDPQSSDSNLTLVNALAAAGRYDDAMSAARKTIGLLAEDADSLARLANTLARPELEGRCGALALEAVEAALAAEPEEPAHLQTKFRILALCQKDLKAAETVGRYAIEKGGDNAGFLNNLAWSLLTDEGLKGNFNGLALDAAQRCHELTKGEDWMYLDTLALAKFETGATREAAELETKAIELARAKNVTGQSLTDLEAALKRFQEGSAG